MKKKQDELKKLSAQELAEKAEVLRRELFSVRLSKATQPPKDTTFIRKMRREIARVLTHFRQKQAER